MRRAQNKKRQKLFDTLNGMQDPDEVGTSEYRAVYELAQELIESEHDRRGIIASLNELCLVANKFKNAFEESSE